MVDALLCGLLPCLVLAIMLLLFLLVLLPSPPHTLIKRIKTIAISKVCKIYIFCMMRVGEAMGGGTSSGQRVEEATWP
jgi:hypothetical protein